MFSTVLLTNIHEKPQNQQWTEEDSSVSTR